MGHQHAACTAHDRRTSSLLLLDFEEMRHMFLSSQKVLVKLNATKDGWICQQLLHPSSRRQTELEHHLRKRTAHLAPRLEDDCRRAHLARAALRLTPGHRERITPMVRPPPLEFCPPAVYPVPYYVSELVW